MKILKKWAGTLFALSLVLGALYVIYLFVAYILDWFAHLPQESEVTVAIIAAAATIVGGMITIALTRRAEYKSKVLVELRSKKLPIYENLITTTMNTFTGEVAGKKPSEKELVNFFVKLNSQLMTWGSDKVISRWGAFRSAASNIEGEDIYRKLLSFENLILAIRKDLGHSNSSLKEGDILRLFVNDLDEKRPSKATKEPNSEDKAEEALNQ